MSNLTKIAGILIVVGALNWGLVGLGSYFSSDWNLVALIFGTWLWLENLIYIIVGLAGVYFFVTQAKSLKQPVSQVERVSSEEMM